MTRFALLGSPLCLALFLLGGGQGIAQTGLPEAPAPQTAPGNASSSGQGETPSRSAQAGSGKAQSTASDEQLKAEEKQRLLGIMPAFNTVPSGAAPPLRPSQKFDLWFHSAVDPFTFAVAGIDAGVEQAEDTYPEYHYGFAGFARRFGAAYADNVDGNFWGNAVLPVVLHQDPRYFRLGRGTFKRRLWYAAISTVRCKGDNGKWQPSYSNVGGNLIGGAISNLYYPASDRGFSLAMERGFTVTAEGAFGALAFEFYPDAIQYLKRRHEQKTRSAGRGGTPTAP